MNKTTETNKESDVCPKCGGKIFMVEYPLTSPVHYDGVSEYACQNALGANELSKTTCDYRIGRFCGKPLAKSEMEPPYCNGKAHPLHL